MNIQSLAGARGNTSQLSGGADSSFASSLQQARTGTGAGGSQKGNTCGCDLQQIKTVLAEISTLIEKLLTMLKTCGIGQGSASQATTSAGGTAAQDATSASSMVPNFAPAIDANGNQVYIDSNGNIVDAAGNAVDSASADAPAADSISMVPGFAPAIDANGNQVFIDAEGVIVDAAGNPVAAETGEILVPVEVPQVAAYPSSSEGPGVIVDSEGHTVSA